VSTFNEKNMNEEISRMLKELPKINAPINFETELSKRINLDHTKIKKENWFDKIFSPKMVPSAALVVTTVIIILVLRNGSTQVEDPFQILPKLRIDKISMLYQTDVGTKEEVVGINERQTRTKKSNAAKDTEPDEGDVYRTDSNSAVTVSYMHTSDQQISVTPLNYPIDHAIIEAGGLNYKIVRLNDEERRQIELLREKMNPPVENLRKN
jgi:hypothetical protein